MMMMEYLTLFRYFDYDTHNTALELCTYLLKSLFFGVRLSFADVWCVCSNAHPSALVLVDAF